MTSDGTTRTPIQLTQLRAFEAVARLGSLTAAAHDLAYTEPAVHLQLAALGKAVGGKLFTRAHRGMVLTSLGTSLLPHAQAALLSVDSLALEAAHHRAVAGRVVRIGVGRSTGSYLFPHLVAAVRDLDRDIVLEPSLMPVGDLYQALSRGELDIVYASELRSQRDVVSHLGPRELVTIPFRRYHWFLVALPHVASISQARDDLRTVFIPEYARLLAPRLQAILPTSNHYTFTLAQNAEATKGAALAGMGIACVPAYTVGSELTLGSLVNCFPDIPPVDNMIYIGHERRPRHPDVSRVVAATRRLPNFSVDGLGLPRFAGHPR